MDRATLLVPDGRGNRVLVGMRNELRYSYGTDDYPSTATGLAESAAEAFGREEWLEDSDHWIWDAACIALEEFEKASGLKVGGE